jgi:dihydroorotate dehydrogenase (NAD+) catalytic subunit
MVDLSVQIGGLALANPIMPASGTFSPDIARVIDPNRLGALVTKSATLAFRAGNPTPRVCETAEGMLNSIGIPSQGIDYFVNEVIPQYRRFTPPLVARVSADTPDEFVAICERVSIPAVDAIEVNISCPNLEEGGRAYAMRAESTFSVMRRVRACTDKPLWAKLTPNTGEIANVARAAEEGGADALVVANTVLGMAIDTETRRPKLGNVMGGLSGPAIKPIIVGMVYQSAKAVGIPVIGCGGIMGTDDVVEYMLAGATAVQVGTKTFLNPTAMLTIIEELDALCAAMDIASVSELTGAVVVEPEEEGLPLFA